jgi:hypothetical protein
MSVRFVRCRLRTLYALSQLADAAFVPLVFIAFQSDEAQRRFPGIDALKPGEQLLGISDEGAVYRGAHAWIMCLWALEDYREHAQRLAHPVLLPLAKAVCELLSRNRFFLSDALFRQEPHSAARKRAAHYGLHNATWANAGCRRYEPTNSALKRGVNETFGV